jgi:coenzyme F420-dependent glucose-6-phosphate dehydrogenase
VVEIGYALSSEEHTPSELVRNAGLAEEAGFGYALISDHIHPWIDRQGHSAFVWSAIGAIARETQQLRLGTGVTCPLIRIHPAIVAHGAATCATLMPGRFFLGVGTGENLNEHVLGDRWPAPDERLEMLEEAIDVIRQLWQGEQTTHRGVHYTVEQARIYDVPDDPPPIAVAAAQPLAARLAGRLGDALISVAPDASIVQEFEEVGGADKPRYGQIHVCYADDEAEARRTAHEWWPNIALQGALGQELPLPEHYDAAAETVREGDVAELVACGPDPEPYVELVRKYAEAGFTHVYIHQVGPDQEGFFRFYERELSSALAAASDRRAAV